MHVGRLLKPFTRSPILWHFKLYDVIGASSSSSWFLIPTSVVDRSSVMWKWWRTNLLRQLTHSVRITHGLNWFNSTSVQLVYRVYRVYLGTWKPIVGVLLVLTPVAGIQISDRAFSKTTYPSVLGDRYGEQRYWLGRTESPTMQLAPCPSLRFDSVNKVRLKCHTIGLLVEGS